jgi:hypothetical protein
LASSQEAAARNTAAAAAFAFRVASLHIGTWAEFRIEENKMLGIILIVVLVMALLGVLPRWSHSRDWGYAPSGGVGLVLLIIVVLLLLGRL